MADIAQIFDLNRGEVPPPCKNPAGHKWIELNSYSQTVRGNHHERCDHCKAEQFYDSGD